MHTSNKRFVFITGVSSGIGYALLNALTKNGFHVIGTTRKEADADRLKNEFDELFYPIVMDITLEEDLFNASKKASKICGEDGLFALINNAGIAMGGPMKYIDVVKLRNQFEINVFGVVALTQQLLPLLERGRQHTFGGKILNMSSVSGLITSAFLGPYSASKFALEAISEAMRIEFAPFGIQVVILEPGAIKTPIWQKALTQVDEFGETEYGPHLHKLQGQLDKIVQNAVSMDVLVQLVLNILSTKQPKARYLIVKKPFMFKLFVKFMPASWKNSFQSRIMNTKDIQ